MQKNASLCLNILVNVVKDHTKNINFQMQLINSFIKRCVEYTKQNNKYRYLHERLLVSYLLIIDSIISDVNIQKEISVPLNLLNEFSDGDNIIFRKYYIII